ncbi:hypothetical protein AaE_006799 [Aphanomyces astaci]|uniref:EF-hand domain-containing protein n=1 Tax=Aphanomyces astaci TaxID=112090 RepID=A0A6A5AJZ2_APHAT|nr:hypothetical protein AaE_006799 [Aphanomyces astaci]
MVLPKVDECRGGAAVVKRGRTLSKPLDAAGVIDANVAALRSLELSKLPFMEEMVPYRARRHPETLSTLARCTAYTIRKKALELQAQAPLAHDHTFFSNESQSNSLQHVPRRRPTPLRSIVRPTPPPSTILPEYASSHSSAVTSPKTKSLRITYRATPHPSTSPPKLALKFKRKRPSVGGGGPTGHSASRTKVPEVTQYHGHLSDYNIEGLMADTGFSRAELYTMWSRFKALCSLSYTPKGVDQDTFRRGVPLLSIEDSLFVDRVFSILDEDKSGIIEWPEFIRAMSALEKGDLRDRIRFLFQVYDLNCDGTIGRDELATFFIASLMVNTPNDDLQEVTRQFVDEILFKLHPTGGGVVTSQDVINYIDQAPQDDIFTLFGRTMLTETDRRRAQEEHMTGATLDMDNNEDDDPA